MSTPPRIGNPYTATCNVTVPRDLQASVDVYWINPSGNVIAMASGVTAGQVTFTIPNLQQSDLGNYVCRTTISSLQLNNPVTVDEVLPVQSKWTLTHNYILCPTLFFASILSVCLSFGLSLSVSLSVSLSLSLSLPPSSSLNLTVPPPDPCADGSNPCPDSNSRCVNQQGSAVCVCNTGYQLDSNNNCIGQYV